ncbi:MULTISPECIES: bacteriocin [Chryseobacterium]|uniref:bacteriocin n=1 Tax=Chryseobacterium TaxID=59732 RepID=UPI001628D43D|nr:MULTISPECIES: bacteriocin [Chryseobacterium]MDM1556677.1 bacteriocin [Chryseobacterium indologenes]
MKKLTKKDLKKIQGGYYYTYPDANGNCFRGWYLCRTNICILDDPHNPIQPDHPFCAGA